jgi:uncharacterized repeat protein (TIGR01451 family)
LSPDIRVFSVVPAGIALIAFVMMFYVANNIFKRDHQPIYLPTPEHRNQTVPGDDTDRLIGALSSVPRRQQSELSETYNTLRARLDQAARTLLAQPSLDDEQLRQQLTEGTWTDDPHAAAFFGEPFTPEPSLREQLRSLGTGELPVQRRARRTIAALVQRLQTGSQGEIPASDSDRHGDTQRESIPMRSIPPERPEIGNVADPGNQPRIPDEEETITRRTRRWEGASALALGAVAGGVILRRPALLLASVIGVGVVTYARAATPPPVDLELERTVSDACPAVGAKVRVTVTVRNVGDTLLPDCSVVDGVPPGLVVANGSPRHGVALRPGKTATFSYTVTAVRGEHIFTSPVVIARAFSGSVESHTRIEPLSETTITCVPQLAPLETVWLRTHAHRFGAQVMTDTAGSGVEFHAVREYHPNDSRSRIDWNRLAKTGELSTLQFREERVTTVVLVIDAREEAYLAPESDSRSAVDRSVEAAGRVFATLLDGNTCVGIAALSSYPEPCWLPPGTGEAHRERARQILATHPALSGVRPTDHDTEGENGISLDQLRRHLPADAQVVVLTPLCDEEMADAIRQFEALGYDPTVISPDPTVLSSPGRQLAHIERVLRIRSLRSGGIPTLDWQRAGDEPLSVAIDRLRIHGRPRVVGYEANARRVS